MRDPGNDNLVSNPPCLKVIDTFRYRNPDNPEQTWAGRGRKPGWLVELLSQGKTLEDLLA